MLQIQQKEFVLNEKSLFWNFEQRMKYCTWHTYGWFFIFLFLFLFFFNVCLSYGLILHLVFSESIGCFCFYFILFCTFFFNFKSLYSAWRSLFRSPVNLTREREAVPPYIFVSFFFYVQFVLNHTGKCFSLYAWWTVESVFLIMHKVKYCTNCFVCHVFPRQHLRQIKLSSRFYVILCDTRHGYLLKVSISITNGWYRIFASQESFL